MKVGDQVETINDVLTGRIRAIRETTVLLETEDGFEIEVDKSDVVPRAKADEFFVSKQEIDEVVREKESNISKPIVSKRRVKEPPVMEVDLHIEKLVRSYKGLSNYEILNLQMETAKRQLEFAVEKRITRVVFIHGVGEGVLKEELNYFLNRYDNVRIQKGDYKKYGAGATEAYILQNPGDEFDEYRPV